MTPFEGKKNPFWKTILHLEKKIRFRKALKIPYFPSFFFSFWREQQYIIIFFFFFSLSLKWVNLALKILAGWLDKEERVEVVASRCLASKWDWRMATRQMAFALQLSGAFCSLQFCRLCLLPKLGLDIRFSYQVMLLKQSLKRKILTFQRSDLWESRDPVSRHCKK